MVDFATADPRFCASLVASGAKQLDEFPGSRRKLIADALERIKAEQLAKFEAAAKEAKKNGKPGKAAGKSKAADPV